MSLGHNSDHQVKQANRSPLFGASFALNQVWEAGRFIFKTGLDTFLDLVFPPICIYCQRVGEAVCPACREKITPIQNSHQLSHIDQTISVGMHVGPLRAAVHALKYRHEQRISDWMGSLLAEKVNKLGTFDTIIPVPLGIKRLQERGYNQANSIAHSLKFHLKQECQVLSDALLRTRETESQVGKSADERWANLQYAFEVSPTYQQLLIHRHILLVDDVLTTGATLVGCATALRSIGVASLQAATVTQAGFIPLLGHHLSTVS